VFYTAEYYVDILTVASSSPVEFSFLTPVVGNVTTTGGVIEGLVRQVFVSSGGENLRFLKKVSTTQYATNIGVLNIGEQYTVGPITFIWDLVISNTPPSSPIFIPPGSAIALFRPFFGLTVTDSSRAFEFLYGSDAAFKLFARYEASGFRGIELKNPFFGVRDMQLYPPYPEDDYDGTWIFQFANSNSAYRALPAGYSTSGIYRFYECSFESISFSIGSLSFAFSSFSLVDGFNTASHAKSADSMAFELF